MQNFKSLLKAHLQIYTLFLLFYFLLLLYYIHIYDLQKWESNGLQSNWIFGDKTQILQKTMQQTKLKVQEMRKWKNEKEKNKNKNKTQK